MPLVLALAHLDDPLLLVVLDVGERAGGDFQGGVLGAIGGFDDAVGQAQDPLVRPAVRRIELFDVDSLELRFR